jgi:ribosomal protein S18 acetylase RimI-like enzyme
VTEPVIRAMTADDIPIIAEWMVTDSLWRRYGMDADTITADFRAALERDDLLLVVDTDLPARGFAWCLLNGMFGTQAYLKRIGVDPVCTGLHIGEVLLTGIEGRVRDTNRDVLFLLVSDFNDGARRFYERHGYRQIGQFPELAISGVTELLFSKELWSLAYSPKDPS